MASSALAELHPFVHLLFMSIIALFPVVNPIGTAFIVMPYFAHLSEPEQKAAVRKITIYAFGVCTVAMVAGRFIMELFGISIPVVQLAGGIMICKFGWEFLSSDGDRKASGGDNGPSETGYQHIQSQLFYPITFPITTGAGTISVLFTLSAHTTSKDFRHYFFNTGVLLLAIVITCLMVYVCFSNTKRLVRYLGAEGEKIVNHVIAFLIFCVGVQIATSGAKAIFELPTHMPETPHSSSVEPMCCVNSWG